MLRLGLVVAVVVLAGWMSPVGAPGQVPSRDVAAGHGDVSGPGSTCTEDSFDDCYLFDFDALSDPLGGDPSGHVRASLSTVEHGYTAEGPVSCLAVTGSRAVIGVDTNFMIVGNLVRGVFVVAVDGGPEGSGLDTFNVINRLDFLGLPNAPPTDCTVAGLPTTGEAVTHGDIVVTDAQPFPTTKDDCKNGGWRNFPDFKSQGQCVAFVQRGPKG
jgi:hypothetical protein